MNGPSPTASTSAPRWRPLLWFLPVAALIVAQLRPVLGHFDRAVLATLDGADALMQSGILTWSARHVWQPAGWLDLPIFFPARSALVYMDSLLGQALLVAPLTLLGDPAPALLYNLACMLTLVLTGLAGIALWLVVDGDRSMSNRAAGAGICALLLLGSPFTSWQLGMLNQISPPWPVFFLAAAWKGWRRFQVKGSGGPWWWWAAASMVIQATWGWYGFADAVFCAAAAGTLGIWRAARGRQAVRFLKQLAIPLTVAGAMVLAVAWPNLAFRAQEPEYTRSLAEVRSFSADMQAFGNLGPHRATPRDFLGGSDEAPSDRAMRNSGMVLHPGWLTLVGVVLALVFRHRMTPGQRGFGVLLGVVAALGLVMAFGDSIGVLPGQELFRLPLPFGILQEIAVPFRAFRAPVRFAYLATIGLAWWATVGFTCLSASLTGKARRGILIGVITLVWLESVPMALLAVPTGVDGRSGRHPLPAATPQGAILTLPAPRTEQDEDRVEVRWLHRALSTGRPVTGGVSGWVPPATRDLRLRLASCEAGETDPLTVLASLRASGVVGVEMNVGDSDGRRVAFWSEVLARAGSRGVATAPGYRFYALADSLTAKSKDQEGDD